MAAAHRVFLTGERAYHPMLQSVTAMSHTVTQRRTHVIKAVDHVAEASRLAEQSLARVAWKKQKTGTSHYREGSGCW
jgi:hypothetical protein